MRQLTHLSLFSGIGGLDLCAAVKMWPTPTASDLAERKPGNPVVTRNGTIRHRNKAGGQSFMRLSQVVQLFPTPTAQDGKNSTFPQSQINRDSVVGATMREQDTQSGGQLNPEWVEWLMGFPIGWTDLTA